MAADPFARQLASHAGWKLLNGISEQLQRATTIDEVSQTIAGGGQSLGFGRVRLWALSEDERTLIGLCEAGHDRVGRFVGLMVEVSTAYYASQTLASPGPQIFDGLQHGPLQFGARVPLWSPPHGEWVSMALCGSDGCCVGLLVFDTPDASLLPLHTRLDVLASFARHAAAALERARNGYNASWMQTIFDLESAAQRAETSVAAADIIVAHALRLGFNRARVWVYDSKIQCVTGLAQAGSRRDDEFCATCIPLEVSSYLSGFPNRRESRFFTGDLDELAPLEFAFEEQDVALPRGEWASIPLWYGERFLGLLELDYGSDRNVLYAGQRQMLTLLGLLTAAVIERAAEREDGRDRHQKFQELAAKAEGSQREERRLTKLHAEMLEQSPKLAAMLHQHQRGSEQRILDGFVDLSRRLLGAGIVMLYQYDQYMVKFGKPIISKDLKSPSTPLRSPNTTSNSVQLIAVERELVLIRDAQSDQRLIGPLNFAHQRSFTRRQEVVSFAGVPLIVGDELFGVLCLNYREHREFGPAEADLIRLFADQVLLVLVGLRLMRRAVSQQFRYDLHDTVKSSMLTLRRTTIAAIERTDRAQIQAARHEVQRLFHYLETDIQVLIDDLAPADDPTPLPQSIRSRLSRTPVAPHQLSVYVHPLVAYPTGMLKRAILYLLAEAVVNASEKGGATRVSVVVRPVFGRLRLVIGDDGLDFDHATSVSAGHNGLRSMAKRAWDIGGQRRVLSSIGHGTRLLFDLPRSSPATARISVVVSGMPCTRSSTSVTVSSAPILASPRNVPR